MNPREAPIGIFDSGVGGLSVATEVRKRLPDEHILYLADSEHCPYGGRSLDEIRDLSLAVTTALVEMGAKLVVVACNTASGAAIEVLRERFDLPIVGLEPAVKPAAENSGSRRIAVLATPATLTTERFHRLVDNHGSDVEVFKIACPGFVELVEEGEFTGERALAEVSEVLAPLRGKGVDEIVLGCTHYPFLRQVIGEVVGPEVEIVDSGAAVARQVERVLLEHDLRRDAEGARGRLDLFTTGEPAEVEPIVARLLGSPFEVRKLPV